MTLRVHVSVRERVHLGVLLRLLHVLVPVPLRFPVPMCLCAFACALACGRVLSSARACES